MTALCPWLLEITPTLSPDAAGVGVGVGAGVGVGVDGEYDEPPHDSVIVITTPLRAASAVATVNSRRESALSIAISFDPPVRQ